jgi:hypothetical protein
MRTYCKDCVKSGFPESVGYLKGNVQMADVIARYGIDGMHSFRTNHAIRIFSQRYWGDNDDSQIS